MRSKLMGDQFMKERLRFSRLLLLFMLSLLTACVTTTDSRYADKKDEKKALEISSQLARTYISRGEWEAAKRHLRYAIETDPKNPEAHEGLALVFQNTGELELAEQHYDKALGYAPKNTRVRNNYAVFLFEQERYVQAAKEFNKVAEDVLYEGRLNAFLNLGRCYDKLEKPNEAVATYKRAYLMDKNSVPAIFGMAKALFEVGDYPQSQAYYDEYRKRVDKLNASALWLGIRLADKFGDKNTHASHALSLKNLYPRSREYFDYRAYSAEQQAE